MKPSSVTALGPLHVLSVGISRQLPQSGFPKLAQCENDAEAVRDCFHDVFQLGARPEHISLLSTKTGGVPRGMLFSEIRSLATNAEPDDRILFFFSGHAQRLEKTLYLVPEDAWAADEPSALLDFEAIKDILNGSKARQKLVILDACWSGPDVASLKNFVPAEISKKFLEEYLRTTRGTAVIASSSDSQPSTTQSPNPKLSLFTYHLVAALQGKPAALENRFLTLPKLFEYVATNVRRDAKSYHRKQEPVLRLASTGTIVLGDFRPLLNPAEFDISRYPVKSISFVESEKLRAKDVLTNIKRWTYTEDYIATRVNDELGEYLEEEMGTYAARLKNTLGLASSEVSVDDTLLKFPGGDYHIMYEADDKQNGKLIHRVEFRSVWFERLRDISVILGAFDKSPTEIRFNLSGRLKPTEIIPGLESKGWTITSQLAQKVEASFESYNLVIKPGSILFLGFSHSELLTSEHTNQARLASGVLQSLSPPRH